MYAATTAETAMTITVSRMTVSRSGQVTFRSSDQDSCAKRVRPTFASRTAISAETRHGGRDSNSQPLVLETRALPIELPPYASSRLTVRRVLTASWAELRKLDPVGIVLPVLRRRIRARPAGRARGGGDRSGVFWPLRRPVHSGIFFATPAPTVLPPSPIAQRHPPSRAFRVVRV